MTKSTVHKNAKFGMKLRLG